MDPQRNAYHTAAFIKYDEEWDRSNPQWAVSNENRGSFTLQFRGSSFSLYGRLGSHTSGGDPAHSYSNQINITFDAKQPEEVSEIKDDIISFGSKYLGPDRVHNVSVTVVAGTFSFERATWESSEEYRLLHHDLINKESGGSYTSGDLENWKAQPDRVLPSWCTWEASSKITFESPGNSILVRGVVPDSQLLGSTFNVDIGESLEVEGLNVYAPYNETIDLYRNDNLSEGNRRVTLTTTDQRPLCVSEVVYFNISEPARGSGQATSGSEATNIQPGPTAAPTPDVHRSKSLDGGLVGGIVIGVLLVPSLALLCFVLWRRRKAQILLDPKKQYALTRHVSYERVCSACSKPITDNYRLECVDPSCPAAVDLHLECKEWNTPARHSHAVHQVVNE